MMVAQSVLFENLKNEVETEIDKLMINPLEDIIKEREG
jgi:hypothetical protein